MFRQIETEPDFETLAQKWSFLESLPEDEEKFCWRTLMFPGTLIPPGGSRWRIKIQPTQGLFNLPRDTIDGSRWSFKIQPTQGHINLPEIPPTAVGGVSKVDLR